MEPGQQFQTVSSGWLGELQLTLNRDGDTTKIARRYSKAPLKLQRPFYPEGPRVCHGVLLHTAGGIAGGDRLQVNIALEEGARALLTTAAAAKVYRSAGPPAQQRVTLAVGPGAGLEWLPQETILFNGARYHHHLQVALAADATWMGWDVVRLGRSARQETFASGSWRSLTVVQQDSQPLWVDPQQLWGDSAAMTSPAGLHNAPVVGTFAAVGREVPRSLVDVCRQEAPAADVGVTRLMKGLLCRYRGDSTAQAKWWFEQAWGHLRQHYYGGRGHRPRVWP
ncbi:MAG: urease accessory protein UreD [Cyanobacteria bacterium P01_A01_bin.135]